jgi:rfaE bifunctional protein nucleotidyltransferase chain/domain
MSMSYAQMLLPHREMWLAKKQKIVFTNGVFDVLHVGHLRYLIEAKKLGDILVIGLNSDASVRRLKGPHRPVVKQEDRREMLLGLKPVDQVFYFEEDTPLELIQALQPDVLAKGGDYRIAEIVGADFVTARGGQVVPLVLVDGKSTTNLIDTIVSRYAQTKKEA